MATTAETKLQTKLGEMVRRIVERFDPERIVLFGSHARGEATEHSDVDLLVVLKDVASKRDKAIEIRGALFGLGVAKDVVVVSCEELEKKKDLVGTIVYPALREGRLLYERRSA